MGHGTRDMGHWPSGSAALFTKCHLRPVAKRHAHACVRERAQIGAMWRGLAWFGAVWRGFLAQAK